MEEIGWQNWVSDGAISGTYNQSKRMEAIEIKLKGEITNHYDIYYRVHAEEFGWMGWAKNGQPAGTVGHALRLEAIEVVLVTKGETPPSVTECSFQDAHIATVNYSSHIEDIGWQELRYNGAMSGTTGQMEAIRINLEDQLFEGGIEYRAHVQNIGWQDWVGDNAESGTTGNSKGMEAVQIRLTGQMERIYDVYYRVHSEEFGWLDWTKNGESAGTEGFSLHMEAIEIMLVRRGEAALGPTTTPFMHQ